MDKQKIPVHTNKSPIRDLYRFTVVSIWKGPTGKSQGQNSSV